MKEQIIKYLLRNNIDYNIKNNILINEFINIANILNISNINDISIKKIIAYYNNINKYKKLNKTNILYWINKGYNDIESNIKLNQYINEYNINKKKLNNFDISTFELFLKICNNIHCLNKFNFENIELLKTYYNELNKDKINSLNILNKEILKILNSKRNKRGTPTSLDFWLSLGWDENTAKQKVSKFQKTASHWSLEYWHNKGYNTDDAYNKISELQIQNNKKYNKKYTSIEKSNLSCFSINYWINKGYNIDEAKLKLKQINPSCIEYYNYDYDLYNNRIKQICKHIKNNWDNNKYNTKLWNNTRKQSKEEIIFFEYVKDLNIVHKPFNINIKDNITKIKHIAIYDGYYKYDNNNIILIEYDGNYWHDENKDNLRDFKTFKYRKDIIGIIRVKCKYFKNNKNNIKQEINEAINKIKSNKEKRIKLY